MRNSLLYPPTTPLFFVINLFRVVESGDRGERWCGRIRIDSLREDRTGSVSQSEEVDAYGRILREFDS